MVRRFEYDKMKDTEFQERLAALDIEIGTFARITGVNLTTVERWVTTGKKKQDIPPWVHLMLTYMEEPEGMVLARDVAADIINKDNMFPKRGEYPFAEEE